MILMRGLKGVKKSSIFLNAYCYASTHAITKFAIQNGINQPCRINTFLTSVDFSSKGI